MATAAAGALRAPDNVGRRRLAARRRRPLRLLAGWLTEASSLAHWLPMATRRAAFKGAPLFRAVYLLSFPFSVLGRPLLFLPGRAACPERREPRRRSSAQLLHMDMGAWPLPGASASTSELSSDSEH